MAAGTLLPAGVASTDVAAAAKRQEVLIQNAAIFLSHPAVQPGDWAVKREYLLAKGLTEADLAEATRRHEAGSAPAWPLEPLPVEVPVPDQRALPAAVSGVETISAAATAAPAGRDTSKEPLRLGDGSAETQAAVPQRRRIRLVIRPEPVDTVTSHIAPNERRIEDAGDGRSSSSSSSTSSSSSSDEKSKEDSGAKAKPKAQGAAASGGNAPSAPTSGGGDSSSSSSGGGGSSSSRSSSSSSSSSDSGHAGRVAAGNAQTASLAVGEPRLDANQRVEGKKKTWKSLGTAAVGGKVAHTPAAGSNHLVARAAPPPTAAPRTCATPMVAASAGTIVPRAGAARGGVAPSAQARQDLARGDTKLKQQQVADSGAGGGGGSSKKKRRCPPPSGPSRFRSDGSLWPPGVDGQPLSKEQRQELTRLSWLHIDALHDCKQDLAEVEAKVETFKRACPGKSNLEAFRDELEAERLRLIGEWKEEVEDLMAKWAKSTTASSGESAAMAGKNHHQQETQAQRASGATEDATVGKPSNQQDAILLVPCQVHGARWVCAAIHSDDGRMLGPLRASAKRALADREGMLQNGSSAQTEAQDGSVMDCG